MGGVLLSPNPLFSHNFSIEPLISEPEVTTVRKNSKWLERNLVRNRTREETRAFKSFPFIQTICRKRGILCICMVYAWLQCEFPLREQATRGFVRLGEEADDCGSPVASALLFIAAAGIPLSFAPFITLSSAGKKRKESRDPFAGNQCKIKWCKLCLNTAVRGVVNENGWEWITPVTPSCVLYCLSS